MKCRFCFILLFNIFFVSNLFSQVTYFIKYKNSVDNYLINQKVETNQLVPDGSQHMGKAGYSIKYFAQKFGSVDSSLSRILKVTFPNQNSADTFIKQIQNDPTVEYVQQANIYKIDSIPNDSLVSQQWALQKIKAFDAWNITEGSDSIIIGVIDTGIDYLHPDLKNKIYINHGETGKDKNGNDKRSNGVDDDGNGFIDDYMGWDFVDNRSYPFDSSAGDYTGWDNNPMDENGHGTYIAGIIGAETNNLIGIAGTAPKVELLNIRAFDASGYGQEDDVAAAILYAVKMGAKVINMSFGDTQFSYVLRDVIKYAFSKGVVLVASSGNSGDDQQHYPSGYTEVISVGNSTPDDQVAPSSSYGSRLDLVAPGTDILTTAKGGGYSEVSGTSASAPFVSAAAGLILSLGNFSNEEVKQILKSTADDIDAPGWDIHSGAGRLNLFNAVSAAVPSIIKFDTPKQDFATNSDTLKIFATILSAYFSNYSLYVGTGIDPTSWTSLIQYSQYQFANKNIFNLNLKSLPDTSYCLRIVVNFSNGKSTEERVTFSIERTAPQLQLVSACPALYGNKATVLASLYSNQPSIVKMFYRQVGSSNFNVVSLDGFSSNTESVSDYHYGFIPLNSIQQNSEYEVYFEAENLAGLKSDLMNNNFYFVFNTNITENLGQQFKQQFSLPAGEIFKNLLSFTSNDSNEVMLRTLTNPNTSYLYKLQNNNFVLIDSIQNKIAKDFGDFNNNGKKDLLCYYVYNGFIYEQQNQFSSTLIPKFADTTGKFWSILAKDIDYDGITEVLDVDSDTSIAVWKVNSNLNLYDPNRLVNFTPKGNGGNLIDAPHAVITDMNGDGKNEIWMVDEDGDIYSYNILGPDNFQKGKVISTNMVGSSAYLDAGNYTGDGKISMAVLLHSDPITNAAPFYKLLIFNFINDSLNIIFNQTFVDPVSEFNSTFQRTENSIRFANIENKNYDDLIIFVYPYSYIFKYDQGKNTVISYQENMNSNSIFVGDLNKNGIPEVAFPTNQGINFYEFAISNSASTPYNLSGFSIDSTRIKLMWNGIENKYYIFKGSNQNNLVLFDSTNTSEYVDTNAVNSKNYFYTVKAFDQTKQYSLSNFSSTINIYSHQPAKVISVKMGNQNSVLVTFSNRVDNKVQNLQSFTIENFGYPNSISAADQYSYLLTFITSLPFGNNVLIENGIKDFYGSPVVPDSVIFFVDSAVAKTEFYISSYQIIGPHEIKLIFNLDVDSASAVNLENYSFEPYNKISSVQFDSQNKNIIYLTLDNQRPLGSVGVGYQLKISNLFSSASTGKIIINQNAGSYIVISGTAKDLSDVYVYPSPAQIVNGEGKITFANVPEKVKISIFNLSGKKITELSGNSNNGGITYNLEDSGGNLLSSGIYLYRIVMLNESNNEVQEKIGKFAVIR
ncbi:MAG: S8 family serine peptidase [Ignavibacteriaceae bacterium]